MNPLPLALCGAGIGLGLCVVLAVLVPARPQLADAVDAPHRAATVPHAAPGNLIQRIGAPAIGVLTALGLPRASVQADLRALDRPVEVQGLVLVATAALCAPAAAQTRRF